MVIIRLAKGGRKKLPFYHIVVADSRQPRDGRYLERLGYYNPLPKGGAIPIEVAGDRVEYWQSQGAQLSRQVEALLKRVSKTSHAIKA